jgi:hypothetical protein
MLGGGGKGGLKFPQGRRRSAPLYGQQAAQDVQVRALGGQKTQIREGKCRLRPLRV